MPSLLVLVACFGLWAAQPSAVEEAWALAAKGNRSDALRLLEKTVHDSPRNAEARLLYGSLLAEEGQRSAALLQLNEGARLQPRSAEAQNALGEAYQQFGKASAARAAFERAVALKPNLAAARLNLGQSLLEANQLAAAGAQLDRASALFGRDAEAGDARYLRAKVYAAQGNAASAAAELEKTVALRPAMAEAWSDLGQARKMLLDEAGALAAFIHAAQANPADAIAQYRLGAQYLQNDEIAPAIEHLSQAARLNPTDQSTLNALQMALRRAGKPQEAQQVKERLTALLREKDKKDQDALGAVKINNEGAALEKAGNLRAALGKYKQALELDPAHVGVRVNYAVALLKLGQWTDGLNELHEALQRDPSNADIQAALDDALKQAPAGSAPAWK